MANALGLIGQVLVTEILNCSQLSNGEIASLQAHLWYLLNPKVYNCQKQHEDYLTRNPKVSKEEMIEYFRDSKGCFGGKDKTFKKMYGAKQRITGLVIGGIEYTTCLCNHNNSLINLYMTFYDLYEKFGVMPFEGPIADQPNKIIEVFNIIQATKNQFETALNKTSNKR